MPVIRSIRRAKPDAHTNAPNPPKVKSVKFEFDPLLIEQSVSGAVHGNPKFEAELHRLVDPLYRMEQGSEREKLFRQGYLAVFAKLGLEVPLTRLVREHPILDERIGRCIARRAPRVKDETAELLVKRDIEEPTPADRTLRVRISPASFISPGQFEPRMRREIFHIADMVDDGFEYRREQIEGLPPRQNLIRDRYRVLWDVAIEGRLTRRGLGNLLLTDSLRNAVCKVFGFETESLAHDTFEKFFGLEKPTHAELFEFARSGAGEESARDAEGGSTGGSPGAPCPLCGFPTFDWFEFPAAPDPKTLASIEDAHPQWTLRLGACRQCAEIYAGHSRATPAAAVSNH